MAAYEEFYKIIAQDIKDEAKDHNKYLELAKMAPTEKAKKILTDIAAEEKIHHKFLEEILSDAGIDANTVSNQEEKKSDANGKRLDASKQIDYPDYIENVGVDPDDFMD